MLSRRRLISAGSGALLTGMAGRAVAAPASGQRVAIRNTHLYVEDSGPRDAPALIYLHGGPGAGSYDFSFYQRDRLSKTLRLIVIDQRGVLRSDPIAGGQPFGFEDLIEDCEALRGKLGLRRWSVLGHSFGGYAALAYALKHPDSISRVLFENPCWDFAASGRYLLRLEAGAFARIGRADRAKEALAAAEAPPSTPTTTVWENFGRLTNALGKTKDDLYVHGRDKQFFGALVTRSGLGQPAWSRGMHQQSLLYKEGLVFSSLVPRLHELKAPALLLKGRYDPVTSPDQVQAFLTQAPHPSLAVFENSSHFAHVEEPDRFARIVSAFVRDGRLAEPDQARAGWSGVP